MSRLLLLLAVAFETNILCAEQVQTHVVVGSAMVMLVPAFKLPPLCGTNDKVAACTAFLRQRLACRCEPAEHGWRLSASAEFLPVMYVLGPHHVRHERDHVKDVEESLGKYLAERESLRFDSAETCQREAARAIVNFPTTMDRFKEDSNAARHPGYRRKLAD